MIELSAAELRRLLDGVGHDRRDRRRSDSPVIELSAAELRRLLDGVGHDLADFLALASDRVRRHLPDHAEPVVGALARVLAVPASGSTRQAS